MILKKLHNVISIMFFTTILSTEVSNTIFDIVVIENLYNILCPITNYNNSYMQGPILLY